MPNTILSASRMDRLLRCPRQHYWSYEIGLKPEIAGLALRFGKSWHFAMEARWQGLSYEDALAKALPEGNELDELSAETVGGLLMAYYARYGEKDDFVREIHPEVEFNLPLAGSRSFSVAGKIDGLAVLADGRLALVEHKTTGDDIAPASDYWIRLRWNAQVFQYVLAARALGWPIETVVYDVTRKPSIRQKQTETPADFGDRLAKDAVERPEFYFARREVPILDQDLDEFITQRLVLSRSILNSRQAQHRLQRPEHAWPRNLNEMTCRFCDYSSFCLQNLSVDLQKPPAGFQVGNPNPELAHAAVA